MAHRLVQSSWSLEQVGLSPPSEPERPVPELPTGLVDLLDSQLMSLYAELVNWTGYAGHLLAVAEIEERRVDRLLQRTYDRYSILYKGEKTLAATKAAVNQEPEYRAAEDAVDAVYAQVKLTRAEYTRLEKAGQAVSRELTRRTSRGSMESRNDRYTT